MTIPKATFGGERIAAPPMCVLSATAMTRVLVAAGSLLLGMTAAFAFDPHEASACVVDESFDPVESAEVIVSGRVTGWIQLPKPTPPPGTIDNPLSYTPILVGLDVSEAYKSAMPKHIEFVAPGSLIAPPGYDPMWGGAGSCGIFEQDPTGQYVVLGLRKSLDGVWVAGKLLDLYVGSNPEGERYDRSIAALSAHGLTALPAGGGPPGSLATSNVGTVIGAAITIAGLALVFAAVRGRPAPSA